MTYLIVGNGRTANHMAYYLSSLGHTLLRWHYKTDTPALLSFYSQQADRILLLIRDSAISSILAENSFLVSEKTLHFSGALEIPGIQNVHPLASFSTELFPLDFYPTIPFAVFDETRPTLESYLPGVFNPSFLIPRCQKALYHGLCVASGNLMVLLWQTVGIEFQKQLNVTNDKLTPYLKSITNNLIGHWTDALTGPIARRDEIVLAKNYQALKVTALKDIFEAHVVLAWPEFAQKHFHIPNEHK
jgi:predicted short-subunit dehydrogenase-like oxidoreductase (DUF2520 family)